MDSLIKASENFEQVNNIEETLDESLFLEYMRKVPIWDFFCVSKNILKWRRKKRKKKYHSITPPCNLDMFLMVSF